MSEASPAPRLMSVVVPCLNGAVTLARLVEALREQRLPDGTELEILVVDNGSDDGSRELAERLPVRLLEQPRRGPAAARNTGLAAARGEVIIFLDVDTRPAGPDFISRHLAALQADPAAGISGGAISPDPAQRSLVAFAENATALFNWHDRLPPRPSTFQPSGNMAMPHWIRERVGPMDESLCWLEDFDWCQRVLQAGCTIRFTPRAGVYIQGRDSLSDAVAKFYRWGLLVRQVYLPGRPDQFWLFPDHPILFMLNGPVRLINETWVTLKRWFPYRPGRILLALPLVILYRAAWAWGLMRGGRAYLLRRQTARSARDVVSP